MMDDVQCMSPVDTKSDKGHVGRSLEKGSGCLLPGVMASFLVKDAFGHNDGNCAILMAILVDYDIFFTPGAQDLRFQLHSGMGYCCPHATVTLEWRTTCRNVTQLMSRGLILMMMALR